MKKTTIAICISFIFATLACSSSVNDLGETPEKGDKPPRLEGVLYPDELVQQMGKGFDVAWSEFNKYIENHDEKKVRDIANAGFTMVRIRVNKPATEDLFSHLDIQIDQCLKYGLIPVLANQGLDAEEATDVEAAKADITNWWRTVAEHYKDYSDKLAFNLFVETSGNFKKDYDLLNEFYAEMIPAIRESNPHRILIVPPVGLSKPANLKYIELPDESDPFIMMEWHCYAAGPALSGTKQWTTGTEEERQLVLNHFEEAKEFMKQSGRVTWLGAWMAGNYNKGNEYDIPSQVQFATFFVRELAKMEVPWCINTDDKFYDYLKLEWLPEGEYGGIPVRDVILDTEKISLYDVVGYDGDAIRLAPGDYDQSELQRLGFNNKVSSLMVPWGFKVLAFTDSGFSGTSTEYHKTTRILNDEMNNSISSLRIIKMNSY